MDSLRYPGLCIHHEALPCKHWQTALLAWLRNLIKHAALLVGLVEGVVDGDVVCDVVNVVISHDANVPSSIESITALSASAAAAHAEAVSMRYPPSWQPRPPSAVPRLYSSTAPLSTATSPTQPALPADDTRI